MSKNGEKNVNNKNKLAEMEKKMLIIKINCRK